MADSFSSRLFGQLPAGAVFSAALTSVPAYVAWQRRRSALERSGENDPETLAQTKRGVQLGAMAGFLAGTVLLAGIVAYNKGTP